MFLFVFCGIFVLENQKGGHCVGVELRNKSKSEAKLAKMLGESKHKLHEHRGKVTERVCLLITNLFFCFILFLRHFCCCVLFYMNVNDEQMECCAKILSDTMNLLFTSDMGPTLSDIRIIMMSLLRTVIQTIVAMGNENNMVVSPLLVF